MGDETSILTFARFNGVWSQPISSIEKDLGVDKKRQTWLNCAPNISPKLVYKLTYKVGQFLFASFPDFNDVEENYTASRFDVVAYDYIDEDMQLPAAKEFIYLMPYRKEIRSG